MGTLLFDFRFLPISKELRSRYTECARNHIFYQKQFAVGVKSWQIKVHHVRGFATSLTKLGQSYTLLTKQAILLQQLLVPVVYRTPTIMNQWK